MENKFFYAKDGKRHGPVSADVLLGLIVSQQLARTVKVWQKGMADWQSAESIPEILERLSQESELRSADVAPLGPPPLDEEIAPELPATAANIEQAVLVGVKARGEEATGVKRDWIENLYYWNLTIPLAVAVVMAVGALILSRTSTPAKAREESVDSSPTTVQVPVYRSQAAAQPGIGDTPGYPMTEAQRGELSHAARNSGMSVQELEKIRVQLIHQGMFPEDDNRNRQREQSRRASGFYDK